MKKLIMISLLIAFTASARIGETKAECIKRYGEPIKKSGQVLEFYFIGFNIKTYFMNDKCEFIRYEKALTKVRIAIRDFIRRPKMGNQEIQILLKANNLNGWKMAEKKSNIWHNKKANLTAHYNHTTKDHTRKQVDLFGAEIYNDYFFDIYSKKYHDFTNQKKADVNKKQKETKVDLTKQIKKNLSDF